MASTLNKLINEEADPNLICSRSSRKLNRNIVESLAVRVAEKLEEGDCIGAIRIASSDDCMAEVNDVTVSRLRQIHPSHHPDSIIPPLCSKETFTSIEVSKDEVLKAIRSFPNGSAGGPDNLRPQHLKDMTAASAEGGGRLLSLEALTSFVNMVLGGNTLPEVCPFFFGANLIALEKKDGGVRPIVVGCSLPRLVAKVSGKYVRESITAHLSSLQLGFGIPLGAEAQSTQPENIYKISP